MRQKVTNFLLFSAGWLLVALAIIGIFLPVLPTTPFLLLASGCFLKSSPRAAAWLNNHPKYGPVIRDWHEHRAVSRQVKKRANVFIVLSFCLSIYIVSFIWLKIMLAVMCITLLIWFNRLPEGAPVAPQGENT
ncbi:YbaN family protein [Parasalinivibrio latis]|uniref:YbaN family protein n=1 Tax=Parasalinivibrio latis TaxID=2952610 RepID=UPI0030E4228B